MIEKFNLTWYDIRDDFDVRRQSVVDGKPKLIYPFNVGTLRKALKILSDCGFEKDTGGYIVYSVTENSYVINNKGECCCQFATFNQARGIVRECSHTLSVRLYEHYKGGKK